MKRNMLIVLIASMIILAVAAGVTARVSARAERLEARLREVYEGAVLSALRQMEDMQVALSKALLSSDRGAKAQYLNQVSSGAFGKGRAGHDRPGCCGKNPLLPHRKSGNSRL